MPGAWRRRVSAGPSRTGAGVRRALPRAAYRKLFGWPAWQAILSPRLPVEGVLGLTPPLYLLSLAPLSREARAIVTEEFHRHSAWESSHSPIKSPENFWARGRMPDANAHKRPETHDNRRKRSDRSRPGRPTRRGSGRHQGTARMSGIEATSSYGGTEITDFQYARCPQTSSPVGRLRVNSRSQRRRSECLLLGGHLNRSMQHRR